MLPTATNKPAELTATEYILASPVLPFINAGVVKTGTEDLPYPLDMDIAPEGTPNSVLTVAWFMLIAVVEANANSTLT